MFAHRWAGSAVGGARRESAKAANTIPSVWEVPNPALAIVRLYVRNHETWNKKGLTSSTQRFNYDYNDDELAELGKKIEAIAAASVHVVRSRPG